MSVSIDFPATLLERNKRDLAFSRKIAWVIFSFIVMTGLAIAWVTGDPTQFARIGSLAVGFGVFVARRRFLVLREAGRKLERALRDPEQWLVEAIQTRFPNSDITPSLSKTIFLAEDVRQTIDLLTDKLDLITFKQEFAIIIISTLIWGYGDILLSTIYSFIRLYSTWNLIG